MKFHVKEVNNRPIAIFDNAPLPHSHLLSDFLEEARIGNVEDYLAEIEKAKNGHSLPTGFTGNSVDISFYSDHATIEELWPQNEDNPASIEISLEEAKQLLLDWQVVLENWKK